jgi:predicted aspartyl protease
MLKWMMLAAALSGGAVFSDPQDPDAPETLGYREDSAERMTVPITIDGRGPFRFIVDTGAERTIISSELASRLALSASRSVTLASVADVRQVPTVIIPRMDVGRRSFTALQAPALLEDHIGADGMLGVDSLRNQRVVFDFERREMRLSRSVVEDDRWPADTIVVTASTRLGRMVLADATVDGERVRAIVDTGSEITVGNEALRRRLVGRGRIDPNLSMEITSVTGARAQLNYTITRRLRIGPARINNLPIAFGGLELFRQLGLEQRPAILLGMDALRLFQRVSIDFGARRLRLVPGPTSQLGGPLRVAAAR